MESIIPINGRIAIVDDKIDQALPLMRVFAKNNLPYIYYKGDDMDYLPAQPENDIRILFLDLNLLDGRDNQPKEIRSTLVSVIQHIISPNNYPYVLVLWSRQEELYKGMLEELFNGALQKCAPITILEWIKSDFFPNFSEEEVKKDQEHIIIDKLRKIIEDLPAYSYLMQWENCVHISADEVIQNIFHDSNSQDNWQNTANCVLDLFARSYLEQYYNDGNISPGDKAKASLEFLNEVYHDTLESNVASCEFLNANDLQYNVCKTTQSDIRAKINERLLLSTQMESLHQPGCLVRLKTDSYEETVFKKLIDKSLKPLPKQINKEDIYRDFIPCAVVVTPACDYFQKKTTIDRIVKGVIIDSVWVKYVETSEAVYVSPVFNYESKKRILVLNYRYFFTENLDQEKSEFIYRLRNTLLAEIQSKLARHITRQGLMNL